MIEPRRLTGGLVVLLLCGAGCIRTHGPEDLRHDLSQSAGVTLEREFGLTITRSGMVLARWGMKIAGEDDISLKGVRRLEVGVYRVAEASTEAGERARLELPPLDGWETVVRVRESDESIFVMVEPDERGRIRRLLLVVAEPDEWVLVRMRGKLDRLFEDAVEMAFDQSGHPELYASVPREPGWERPQVSAAEL